MSKVLALFVGCLLVVTVRSQETVIQDRNAELRPVKGFHGIRVSSAISLYLTQGSEEKVVVSASDVKTRDRIKTEVIDGILVIRVEGSWKWWHMGNSKLKAYVSFTSLDEITASGASNVYVDGVITTDKLALNLAGASEFKGAIKVSQLLVEQTGASDSHLTGQVGGMATIRLSGASEVKGYDLAVETCSAHASGASNVQITVNKELEADCSGASGVYYRGAGVLRESHSSGASSVSHRS